MKRQSWAICITAGVCAGLLLVLALVPASAQNPPGQPTTSPTTLSTAPVIQYVRQTLQNGTSRAVQVFDGSLPPETVAKFNSMQKAIAAREKLKAAKTDDEKSAAGEELEKTLGEYFDADMKVRLDDLKALKKKLAEMEAYLKKRRAAKDDIVGLQLQAYKNEVEGLGFFPDGGPANGAASWTSYSLPGPIMTGTDPVFPQASPPVRPEPVPSYRAPTLDEK